MLSYLHKRFILNIIAHLIVSIIFTQIALAATEVKTLGGIDATDDSYALSIKGLIQLDDAWFSGSAYAKQGQFPSGGTVQRVYLYISSSFAKNWSFLFNPCTELSDFNALVNETIIIGDAHVSYDGFKDTHLQFGQVAIPSSLENSSYYSDDLFMAVSLPDGVFFPVFDYGIGIYADHTFADTVFLQGAFFQPPRYVFFNGQVGLGKSDRLNGAVRLIASPIHKDTCAVHFGVWTRYQSFYYSLMGAPAPLNVTFQGYDDTPETDARVTGSLINTGPLRIKSALLSGLEFGSVYGPFFVQAEYMGSRAQQIYSNTNPGVPLNVPLWFYGWYVQSSYVLTGESHPYEFGAGIFHRPHPKCWYGAWEIAVRYSYVNLNSKNILGGTETDFTLGLNWYVNNIVRLCANYVHASAHPTLSASEGANNYRRRKLNIFSARIQIDF